MQKHERGKGDRRYINLDNMQILDRLVSIKSNAYQRASVNLKEHPGCNQFITKAATLENGINQLIIEIQNCILAEQIMKDQIDNSISSFVHHRQVIA
jgi:hypothetical protein